MKKYIMSIINITSYTYEFPPNISIDSMQYNQGTNKGFCGTWQADSSFLHVRKKVQVLNIKKKTDI